MNPLSRHIGLFLLAVLLVVQNASARPRLFTIRGLPGENYSVPLDISADGSVVVGASYSTVGGATDWSQAFRYSKSKAEPIPMPLPQESSALSVSADGAAIFGFTYNASSITRAFLWRKETGPVDISSNPDLIVEPSALSGSGQVAVGRYAEEVDDYRPFFWSEATGMKPLSYSGFSSAYPTALDYSGNVIVGQIRPFGATSNLACRWVNMGEPEVLDSSGLASYPTAVTPDGSVIAGNSDAGTRVFRWFFWYGVQWLDAGGAFGYCSIADISADSQVMVGYGTRKSDGEYVGALWSYETGFKDMNELFRAVVPRGWRIVAANAISADGRWITGSLINSSGDFQGFILDLGRK